VTDYRKMLDKPWLGAWDLPEGRDAVVTIARVEAGKVSNGTKESRKPILYLETASGPISKPMVCNATNGRTIATLYGTHVEKWQGQPIALFVGKANFGGQECEAIRVRPVAPKMPKPGKDGEA
jgi:hypothetical protein